MRDRRWESLTIEEFEDALRKGLGRAILHARQSMSDRLLPAIEHALTHNLAYDPQCEMIRTAYLCDLADAAGGLSRFRSVILTAFSRAATAYDAAQLQQLCTELAAGGDDQAKEALARASDVWPATETQTAAGPIPKLPRLADDALQAMSFGELLTWISANAHPGGSLFKRWGRLASYANRLDAAAAIEGENAPDLVRHALMSFWENPFESEPAILLGVFERFAEHPRVTRAAEIALQVVESSEVRDAALDLIQSGRHVGRGLALLCANYEAGDWNEIAPALEGIVHDRQQAHEAGQWLLDLFDMERTAEAPAVMLWTYENSPCANCRERAFVGLHDAKRAPEWMYHEMKVDSAPDSRRIAREATRHGDGLG